jgi:ribosomal protein S27E
MDEPGIPAENLQVEYVSKMMRGELATAREVRCPECGNTALITASPWRGNLAVSVRCQCIEIESDGVPAWPAWQNLCPVSQ